MNEIKATYFIGIGGIGMSAVARYFNKTGILTSGYDKTRSSITEKLSEEGINIHFEDDINLIPENILKVDKENLLIVYTPAVPVDHSELRYFKEKGYKIYKRSEILGEITNKYKTAAVAGTHGKTSVSTLIAHIFKSAGLNFNAFLGHDVPVMMGLSRKSTIGAISGVEEPERRIYGSLAGLAAVVLKGASMVRVHDVKESRQACSVALGIRDQ